MPIVIEQDIKKEIKKEVKRGILTQNKIADIFGVSRSYVQSVSRKTETISREPEPTYEVVKIQSEFLQDALAVLKEFQIKYQLPSEKYELLEMYESKINK